MTALIRPEDIKAAVALLKAAGFRISKPKAKQPKGRVGPSFEAAFADGQTVRMTVFSDVHKLDWERGRRIAVAAWRARMWQLMVAPLYSQASTMTEKEYEYEAALARLVAELPEQELTPPRVVSLRFERDGKVLGQREAV